MGEGLCFWGGWCKYRGMAKVRFERFYVDVEGILRYYYLYVPEGVGEGSGVPLVIVLHGAGGNPRTVRNVTGMNELADEEGFMVAYPQGTGPHDRQLTWNAGQCCGFAYENGIDDVAFMGILIETLSLEWPVDDRRIYAAGVSNGGMLAHRLGCELSGQVAAVAAVAGTLPGETCRPREPVAVIMFHGTADPFVPFEGGQSKKTPLPQEPVSHTSVKETLLFWIGHNGCRGEAQVEEAGPVKKQVYGGGRNNTEVVLYTIHGGGHTWPGTNVGEPDAADPMQQISATPLIWQFFRNHPKAR